MPKATPKKVSIRTNEGLVREFQYLNELFFDRKLKLRQVAFAKMTGNRDGIFNPGKEHILVSSALAGLSAYITIVLLHEMAHANLDMQGYRGYPHDGGHGGRFQVELDRLYKAGAYDSLL